MQKNVGPKTEKSCSGVFHNISGLQAVADWLRIFHRPWLTQEGPTILTRKDSCIFFAKGAIFQQKGALLQDFEGGPPVFKIQQSISGIALNPKANV